MHDDSGNPKQRGSCFIYLVKLVALPLGKTLKFRNIGLVTFPDREW